ncbi:MULTISPECIES: retropepsin-like aspartic protease family protein [unclassified Sphingomonas]|uniref:retropepsin-like aspartic protease family protein n=1 Tax=unclassified Sphingomonas TaxID=196159 RepID=UPI00082E4103|nr:MULTISPECIES: TIGR02281 family clan AA aspartic protease [unclassified Sphingomonas]
MSEQQAIGLIGSVGFLVLVLASLAARRPNMSLVLRSALGWIAIAAVIAILVAFRGEIGGFVNDVGARLGFADQRTRGGALRIPASDDGHYWANVRINGVARRMLIDSGATTTSLSVATAQAAGVAVDDGGLVAVVDTANGPVEARRARIDRLEVGPIQTEDLGVLVAPNFGDVDLLGMNFLSRLDSFRTEQGVLVLEPAGTTASAEESN